MVTHNFNKLLPFLFNMDTLVSDQSSPMTYTNRFCVAMLAVFATYNPSEAVLTVLSRDWQRSILNHLYWYVASTVDGDGDTVLANWLSIDNHNKHKHASPKFHQCVYGRLRESGSKDVSFSIMEHMQIYFMFGYQAKWSFISSDFRQKSLQAYPYALTYTPEIVTRILSVFSTIFCPQDENYPVMNSRLEPKLSRLIPYPPENKPPPFFSSRHDLDWGGGLFSNMHFPSNISPPLATIVGNVPQEISRVCFFSPKERQQDDLSSRRQHKDRRWERDLLFRVCTSLKASWPACVFAKLKVPS